MSFIVSVHGQFRPYDVTRSDRSNKVTQGEASNASKTISREKEKDGKDETFRDAFEKEKKKNQNLQEKVAIKGQSIQAYENVEKVHQRHKKATYARDIMSSPVHTLFETNTLSEAQEFMGKYKHRHIPVLNKENTLVGIISDKDILRAQHKVRSFSPLRDLMTSEVLSARCTTRIQDLARIMLYEKFSALPIIDDNDQLVGIVTLTNILEYVTKESLL